MPYASLCLRGAICHTLHSLLHDAYAVPHTLLAMLMCTELPLRHAPFHPHDAPSQRSLTRPSIRHAD
eukprot:1086687-Pelagomonas_calceolata.AAC.1